MGTKTVKFSVAIFATLIAAISAYMFQTLGTCVDNLSTKDARNIRLCLGSNLAIALILMLIYSTDMFKVDETNVTSAYGWIVLFIAVAGIMISNAFVASFLEGKSTSCKKLYDSALAISIISGSVLCGFLILIYKEQKEKPEYKRLNELGIVKEPSAEEFKKTLAGINRSRVAKGLPELDAGVLLLS